MSEEAEEFARRLWQKYSSYINVKDKPKKESVKRHMVYRLIDSANLSEEQAQAIVNKIASEAEG